MNTVGACLDHLAGSGALVNGGSDGGDGTDNNFVAVVPEETCKPGHGIDGACGVAVGLG